MRFSRSTVYEAIIIYQIKYFLTCCSSTRIASVCSVRSRTDNSSTTLAELHERGRGLLAVPCVRFSYMHLLKEDNVLYTSSV